MNTAKKFKPESNEDSHEKADVISLDAARKKLNKTLSREGVGIAHDVIGTVYSFEGRDYIIEEMGFIYEAETGDLVTDENVYDFIYDEFLQDAQKVTLISQRAAEMAQGDPVIEEALKAHFAFTGLPSDKKRYSIN